MGRALPHVVAALLIGAVTLVHVHGANAVGASGTAIRALARAAATENVRGHVTYALPTGEVNPVREAIIEVIDARVHATGCPRRFDGACVLGTTVTTSTGNYSFGNVSTRSPNGTRRLLVRVYAEGSVNGNHTWFVTPVSRPRFAYHFDSPPISANREGVTDVQITSATPRGRAFSIFDITRLAADWADANGVTFSVHVRFPVAGSASSEVSASEVNVPDVNAFQTDDILHEIGHTIADRYHLDHRPAIVNDHFFGQDLTVNGKDMGVWEAWQEGFGDFFAVRVRNDLPASDLPNRPELDGSAYHNFSAGSWTTVSLGDNSTVENGPNGEGDELSVARILWLLSEGRLGVPAMSLPQMIQAFSGKTETLSDAIDALKQSSNSKFGFGDAYTSDEAQVADAVGCRLVDNHVGPDATITGATAETALDPTNPPTLKWRRGGTPTFHLDQFNVYFYDDSTSPATFIPGATEMHVPNNAGGTDNEWAWRPDPTGAAWQALLRWSYTAGAGHSITLEVEGQQAADTPQTGPPYPGCGQTIGHMDALVAKITEDGKADAGFEHITWHREGTEVLIGPDTNKFEDTSKQTLTGSGDDGFCSGPIALDPYGFQNIAGDVMARITGYQPSSNSSQFSGLLNFNPAGPLLGQVWGPGAVPDEPPHAFCGRSPAFGLDNKGVLATATNVPISLSLNSTQTVNLSGTSCGSVGCVNWTVMVTIKAQLMDPKALRVDLRRQAISSRTDVSFSRHEGGLKGGATRFTGL